MLLSDSLTLALTQPLVVDAFTNAVDCPICSWLKCKLMLFLLIGSFDSFTSTPGNVSLVTQL